MTNILTISKIWESAIWYFFFIIRNMKILIFLQFWDGWIYITFSILQNFSLWNLSYLKYDNLNMTIFFKILKYDNQ